LYLLFFSHLPVALFVFAFRTHRRPTPPSGRRCGLLRNPKRKDRGSVVLSDLRLCTARMRAGSLSELSPQSGDVSRRPPAADGFAPPAAKRQD